jgi:hypothetical protein
LLGWMKRSFDGCRSRTEVAMILVGFDALVAIIIRVGGCPILRTQQTSSLDLSSSVHFHEPDAPSMSTA